jgi:Asp-tRNA(Asn)/Glu-tRNA(Gln) amidotransferase A subunit family amidase
MSSRPAEASGARQAAQRDATAASALARMVRDGELSAIEVVDAALERIDALDGRVGAFVTVAAQSARDEARAADRAVRAGSATGPLHGVPFAVKDLEWTAGIRTTMGSRAFERFVPDQDAIMVARLRAAGAIVVGKTNTPEFGLLGETRNPLQDETRNPWNLERTTGGSSGGSAAALAAGMVPLATGNDTAGSISCPSAMCGTFGIKPTHGRVPSWPDPGDSRIFLDAGPMTRTVADAALALRIMSGPDARDPISRLRQPPPRPAAERRIAWSPDWGRLAVDPEVRRVAEAAVLAFEELGYRVEERCPEAGDPLEVMLPLIAGDARVLVEATGLQPEQLSADVVAELELLGEPSVTEYIAALNGLCRFRHTLEAFFESAELMVTPSTAVPAFPLGTPPSSIDGRPVSPRWTSFMPFQAPWNLTGQPTASIPCGQTADGLPIGLQVTAARWCDERLLEACAGLERLRPWQPVVGSRPTPAAG